MNEEQVRKMVEEMLSSVVAKTAASVSVGKFVVTTTWNVTSTTDGDKTPDTYVGSVDLTVKWDSESK